MKKLIAVIFLAMLIIIPQSTNAYTLPLNMSLDPATTYVSKGDTFSVTLDVGIDYSELETLYPSGFSVYWSMYFGSVEYNGNVVTFLGDNGLFNLPLEDYTEFKPGGVVVNHFDAIPFQEQNASYILYFQALQNGYTDFFVEAVLYASNDFYYYDPTDPNAFESGWVQDSSGGFGDIFAEGSVTGGINVPEPATMLLLGLGLIGLAGVRRKIKK